jgi:hypothetical protein
MDLVQAFSVQVLVPVVVVAPWGIHILVVDTRSHNRVDILEDLVD